MTNKKVCGFCGEFRTPPFRKNCYKCGEHDFINFYEDRKRAIESIEEKWKRKGSE